MSKLAVAVIDFDESIKASQILPISGCSTGNNHISVLPQQQDNVQLDVASSQNPGFSTVTDTPTIPFDTTPKNVATLQNLHLLSPGMPATVTSAVSFNNPATAGSNLHCLAPVSTIRLANNRQMISRINKYLQSNCPLVVSKFPSFAKLK